MPRPRKLTPQQVNEIREWGDRWKAIPARKEIAGRFGVSEHTIAMIVSGQYYRSVKRNESDLLNSRKAVKNNVISRYENEGVEHSNGQV